MNRLRQMRIERELSQTQLAQAAGVTQPLISALEQKPIEQPDNLIRRRTLRKIADALGVEIEDLMEDERPIAV